MGNWILKATVVLLLLFIVFEAQASDYSLDNTCNSCSRRENDSLNVFKRRPIRVNQAGFRPQDPKKALVADPAVQIWRLINVESGQEALSGSLIKIGSAPRPGMWINGAFNSTFSVYEFGDSAGTAGTETLYEANFSDVAVPGRYAVVVGKDTSAVFRIDEKVFNYLFENTLRFFGAQRCGDTDSWFHGACHLQDGSAIGRAGSLTGGWHDCGDHFKVAETIGFSAFMLTLTYVAWPERAEDFFGASYNDTLPFGTDGIPDLLWESKIGADYLFKLYKESKRDGLIALADMYHSVGVSGADHNFWDLPERQDAQPASRGGPDRVVADGTGANMAGMTAASLALFAHGWELFDRVYADSLKQAAIDIYDNVVMKKLGVGTSGLGGFYTGGGRLDDDPAAAALALWVLTKDPRFGYDLLQNKSINNNGTAQFNDGEFPAGHFGNPSGFHHGGWTTDYQQIHAPVMYAFAKLILGTEAKAAQYGISPAARDSLLEDAIACLRKSIDNGSNGNTTVPTKNGMVIHVDKPYGGVFTSVKWGYNRYNMGMVNELFMFHDLTGEKEYFDIAMDNLYYNLGMNPWDVSFVMGAGDKNLQHPHNRAANPDGYNAGGVPYEYKCPIGALMGGAAPSELLKDDWSDYTVTETCIDFSAGFLFPAQMVAQDLPPDNEGPLLSNIVATPISATDALISWEANELAGVTVYLAEKAKGPIIDTLYTSGVSKSASVLAQKLTEGKTYYFYLESSDIRKNISTDDNHGNWYSFVMKSSSAQISDVRICQVDDQNAKVYWWTSNGAFNTTIRYGTSPTQLDQTLVGDNGQPVMFHEALLTKLSPGTTYYFDVASGTSVDDNGGKHYQFTTNAHAVYLDYTVTIKPTKKANGSAHFYIEVTNNEAKPYTGLELRFYYKLKNGSPGSVTAKGFDKQIFDVGGMPKAATIQYGPPKPVAGTDYWYMPIVLKDELPVSGRASFELQLNQGDWGSIPFADLADSWSLISHTTPQNFAGVDLAMGAVYTGPSQLETVNGKKVISYVKDPFITAYYEGTHVFGYPPDFADGNMPVSKREMNMLFSSPFASPQTFIEQDGYSAQFTGTAWTLPIGSIDRLEMNALNLTSSALVYPVSGRFDSISFSHTVDQMGYGANRQEFVAWHNVNANSAGSYDCACAYKRLGIEVDSIAVLREKRYIRLAPADTVRFYQGKRRMVKVSVQDSLGNVISSENYSLNVKAGINKFLFYSDPSSTVPISRITLTNGEGSFYVGYEGDIQTPVSTLLLASVANPLSAYNYIVDSPLLVAEPLPPWPIIERAVMLDTDCDQIPDAMDIEVSTDFESGKYDFSKLEFELAGDTIILTQKIEKAPRTFRFAFKSTDPKVLTNPTGLVNLFVKVAGAGEKISQETYLDGIGPTVVSVAILENPDKLPTDSLFVQFSEPVSVGMGWMFNVYDSGQNAIPAADTPAVVGAKLVDDSRNIWAYVIASNGSGPQPIQEGMHLQLKSDATLLDRNGNGIAACGFPKIRVSLKRHPIPIDYASIGDADGDGRAEQVKVHFQKAVDSVHVPSRMRAIFGFFQPETLSTSSYTWNTDRTEAILQLAQPFATGNTAGTYSGVLAGAALVNAGWVDQEIGTGADFESQGLVAEDKAGPILLTATLSKVNPYYLDIEYSEPLEVHPDSVTKELLVRERGGSVNFKPYSWKMNGKTKGIFVYHDTDPGALIEGDMARFHTSQSRFSDASGNVPAINNPWVPVQGKNRADIQVRIAMVKAVQKGGDVTGYGAYPIASGEYFRVVLFNAQTKQYDIWKNGVLIAEGIDTAGYHFQGPTFDFDITLPRGSAPHQPPAWDSVKANLEIFIFSNHGNYINRIQQDLVLRDGRYLGEGGRVHAYVEWVNPHGNGPTTDKGRVVGSGAYVGRVLIGGRMSALSSAASSETRARFNGVSFSKSTDIVFGYMR